MSVLESIVSMSSYPISDVRLLYEVHLPYRVCWCKSTKEVYFLNRVYKPLGVEEGECDDPSLSSNQVEVAYMYDDRLYEMDDDYLHKTISSISRMAVSMVEKGYTVINI